MTLVDKKSEGLRAGFWYLCDGVWLWRGPRYESTHSRMSHAARVRVEHGPQHPGREVPEQSEGFDDYADPQLSPEQQRVRYEIVRELGA